MYMYIYIYDDIIIYNMLASRFIIIAGYIYKRKRKIKYITTL